MSKYLMHYYSKIRGSLITRYDYNQREEIWDSNLRNIPDMLAERGRVPRIWREIFCPSERKILRQISGQKKLLDKIIHYKIYTPITKENEI